MVRPAKKRVKTAADPPVQIEKDHDERQILIQFVDSAQNVTGPPLDIPLSTSTENLGDLLNQVLKLNGEIIDPDDSQTYSFMLEPSDPTSGPPIPLTSRISDIFNDVLYAKMFHSESAVIVRFYPLATFRVRPVTRCSTAMSGHTEAVLCVAFSPDGQCLASGSGDTTVRLWDLTTDTPQATLKAHKHWVFCVSWSPDGKVLASAGKDNCICIWNPSIAKDESSPTRILKGHSKSVTSLAWQPLHLVEGDAETSTCKLASASQDFSIRIWDVMRGVTLISLNSHTKMVTCIKWSGLGGLEGIIYSASRDTFVKAWDAKSGQFVTDLRGHAHWVNTLALSSDAVLRTGAYDHTGKKGFSSFAESKKLAAKRYEECIKNSGGERLLSGSDDNTMFLWSVLDTKKPLARMIGHQQPINHVNFSPDGRFIASASYDKSIRLWDSRCGKYLGVLRGHIGRVYQCCWSPDSRMLVSGSSDSTVKVFSLTKRKLQEDLPGHADEVYAVDWSPDGSRAASGSKDRILRIWRH